MSQFIQQSKIVISDIKLLGRLICKVRVEIVAISMDLRIDC
jgi:hypothetical protein